jgi:hypothetical protein
MRWTGHLARMMEMRNAYKVRLESLGGNIKIDFGEIGL